jgi:hypothetical protein
MTLTCTKKWTQHKWTEAERDIIRRDYKGDDASAERIARYFDVSVNAVKGQIQTLGLSFAAHRHWTEDEEEQLKELITQYSVHAVHKMIGRSISSITQKAAELKCSMRTRDEWYNKSDVCEILGVDHHKIQQWINSGALKADRRRETEEGRTSCWHILESDLKTFIVGHCFELIGRNVDLFAIVHIVKK